ERLTKMTKKYLLQYLRTNKEEELNTIANNYAPRLNPYSVREAIDIIRLNSNIDPLRDWLEYSEEDINNDIGSLIESSYVDSGEIEAEEEQEQSPSRQEKKKKQ